MLCQALRRIWGNADWAGPGFCSGGTHGPAAVLQIQAIQTRSGLLDLPALFLGVLFTFVTAGIQLPPSIFTLTKPSLVSFLESIGTL